MATDQIEADAVILEALPHDAYRAELPNGHRCIARPAKGHARTYAPGEPARLSFHPADLSRARIVSS